MCPVLLAELYAVLADADVPGGRTRIGGRVNPDLGELRAPRLDDSGVATRVTDAGTGSTEQTHTSIISDTAGLRCRVEFDDSG